jgi:hypothetical protein
MRAQGSLLGALAIAGAVLAGVGTDGARAQPFGRAYGQLIQVRDDGRREGHRDEGRREESGRGGEGRGRGDQGDRGGYREQPYAPAPRGYAYPAPAPAYRYPQQAAPPPNYAPPQAYAPRQGYAPQQGYTAPPQAYAPPPSYSQPRAYSYAPAPNSLGSGWRPQQEDARRGVREGRMAPLGQVMDNIRRTTPGRMLDAGVEPGPDGRPTYRVRWAAEGGRRIDFIVDAATGAIIGESGY